MHARGRSGYETHRPTIRPSHSYFIYIHGRAAPTMIDPHLFVSMAQQQEASGIKPADADVPPTPMTAPASFKFNVHAPEFVPMSPTATPMSAPTEGYYSPFLQMQAGLAPNWSFLHDHEPVFFMPDFAHTKFATASNNSQAKGTGGGGIDVTQKIVKQVEYQFSDISLVANEFLLKIMNKDSEGYVPLSVIASWKKIKSLGATNQMLVKALHTSTKLIVSDDGKKVRRRQPFTLLFFTQSRMIIAENLPDDSSRSSLEKIFGVVGSVKNIKICHPQEPGSARASKSDTLVSNKMHALVEYETSQQAEKAVEKLNDERNWRKGLRVRTVLRRSPKSVMRLKRPDFDHFVGSDDESPHSQMSSDSPTSDAVHSIEAHPEDHQNGAKKGWARGRGKLHVVAPHSPQSAPAGVVGHFDPSSPRQASQKCPLSPRQASQKCPFSPKQPPQGPRMPDGTRGFTMGRGKPAASSATARAVAAPPPAPVLV